jgi:hypothetical protein
MIWSPLLLDFFEELQMGRKRKKGKKNPSLGGMKTR